MQRDLKRIFDQCPKCRSSSLHYDNLKCYHCPNCSFHYYNNTAAAVGAIIYLERDDRYLVAVRGQEPGLGRLDLIGGFIDPFESAEEALIREIEEELNLKVRPSQLTYFCSAPNTYEFRNIQYSTCDMFFLVKLIDDPKEELKDLKVDQNEIAKLKFLKQEELDPTDFAFSSTQTVIQKWIEKLGDGMG